MSRIGSLEAESVAPSENSQGEAWRIFTLLYPRRHLIYRVVLGATLLALVILFLLSPFFAATTVMIPPQSSSTGLGALSAALGGAGASLIGEGTFGIRNTGETYVSLLTSQTVENAVIRRFNLMDEYKTKRLSDARKILEKRVTVVYGARDGLLRLTVEAHDPNRAAELTNGYVEEFRKFSATLAVTEASQRRMFYEQELRNAKDKLANAEQQLKITEQKTGVMQLDAQARALIGSAATLRAEISAKEVEIQSLQLYATEDNPVLVTAKRELAAMQSQLSLLNNDRSDRSQNVILSKGSIDEGSLEYIRRFREVKYYETLFELLARQFEIAQLDEARQGSTVQIVDKALPPDKKMPQYRVLKALIVALFSFLATCVWLIVQNRWKSSGYAERIRELRSETPS
ncbi:MAG: chain length determinant family protein [Edaphobacter sp.]